jgi:hypothetical protein
MRQAVCYLNRGQGCNLSEETGAEGRNWKMPALFDAVFVGSNLIPYQLSQQLSYLSLILYYLCVSVIAGRGIELSKTTARTATVNLRRRQKKAWVSSRIFAWCRSLEVEEMLSIHQQPCQDTRNCLSLEDNKRLNVHPKVKKYKTKRARASYEPPPPPPPKERKQLGPSKSLFNRCVDPDQDYIRTQLGQC